MVLPNLHIEKSLWRAGYRYIVGIDEVGRGSWAGPLVAAGVILPHDFQIPEGLADSKQVKPLKRAELANLIYQKAKGVTVVEISPSRINRVGIGKATNEAFRKIARTISPSPDFYLIDAFYIKHLSRKKQRAIKSGDKICASIAAASIIAKVYRDRLMKNLHHHFPNYGFGRHKGYGTVFHQQAIKKFGFTKVHRTSYNLNWLLT